MTTLAAFLAHTHGLDCRQMLQHRPSLAQVGGEMGMVSSAAGVTTVKHLLVLQFGQMMTRCRGGDRMVQGSIKARGLAHRVEHVSPALCAVDSTFLIYF